MAVVNGNLRTSAARASSGIEQCEGVLRALGGAPVLVTSPPVVTLVSPTHLSTIPAGTPVVIDVTDDSGFTLLAARVRWLASGERELAYDRDDAAGAWDPRYAGSSVEVLAANHYRLTLLRAGGWPAAFGVLARVVDDAGAAP